MEMRTRLLLVSIALSLICLIDLGANGMALVNNFFPNIVRVTPVDTKGWHVTDDAPFMRKQGSQTHGAEGLAKLRVTGSGDIEIGRSMSDMIVLEYDIRTYGLSRRHIEEYHRDVDVTSWRRGDTLDITLEKTPEPHGVLGVRVAYRLQIPDGMALYLENEFGDINLFGIEGDVDVAVEMGSVRIGEHRGPVRLNVDKGSIWLSKVSGPVTLQHRSGRVEAVGLEGPLEFDGQRSTVTVDQVEGGVRAHVSQGTSEFYSVHGPLVIEADRTRVTVADARGSIDIQGTMSPVQITGGHDQITVTSDQAHVLLRLPQLMAWSFDLDARNGKVHTSLPFSDPTEGDREKYPVTVRVVGGDVRVEPY